MINLERAIYLKELLDSFKIEVENLDTIVKTSSEGDHNVISEIYEKNVGIKRVEEFILEEIKKGLAKELERELKIISNYLDDTFEDCWESLW